MKNVSLRRLPGDKLWETIRELSNAGFDGELARVIRAGRAKEAVRLLREELLGVPNPSMDPPSSLFISLEAQLEIIARNNERLQLGFPARMIKDAARELGKMSRLWPTQQGHMLVLTPYGRDPLSTWNLNLRLIQAQHANPEIQDGFLEFTKESLRLFKGIKHPGRCLRIETIDRYYGWRRILYEVRDKLSTNAGLLAAAAFFPRLVCAMDSPGEPCWNICGFETCFVVKDGLWPRMPFISVIREPQGIPRLYLSCHDATTPSASWSYPRVVVSQVLVS